jgi:hypothetical protein
LLKTPGDRESLEIFVPPPYRRGHDYDSFRLRFAALLPPSKTRWCPPQCDIELMAEKQILGFKLAPRLEQVGYKHSERVQDCKHRYQ